MKQASKQVKEFLEAAGIELPDKFKTLGYEHPVRSKVIELIKEEYDEWILEEGRGHNEKVVKELVDLIYVAIQGLLRYGVDPEKAFNAVHQSNMTKKDREGKFQIKNGKIQKGPNYMPPDMRAIIYPNEKRGD